MTKALFFISILLSSCSNTTNNSHNQIMADSMKIAIPESLLNDKDLIAKRLKVQLSWQDMDETDPEYFNIQKEDIIIGGKIDFQGLLEKGFKPINSDSFNKKVKNIFNLDLNHPDNCKYLNNQDEYYVYIMPAFENEPDESRITGSYDFERQNFYFFKNKNFVIWGVPLITESLQYKENDIAEIKIWDNEYHSNKFFFNDDDQSLSWLLDNDLDFLEILVREFGYDKNDKINEAVLKKIYNNYDNQQDADKSLFVGLFAKKNSQNTLHIRNGLIKYITDNTTIEENRLLTILEDYTFALFEDTDENKNLVQKGFNDFERLQIFTILGYEIEKVYRKNQIESGIQNWSSESCFYNAFVQDNKLKEKIAKENYFNLNGLEKTIEVILDKIEAASENNSR